MYEEKDLYIVDFSKVEHYVEMHNAIKDGLCFPDYYGQNWDAFWDCLTDFCYEKLNIEFRNVEIVKKLFPTALDKLIGLLTDFKIEYSEDFPEGIDIKFIDDGNIFYID